MKRKLRIQCPCGYSFDSLSSEKDAIVQVRSHFELLHKDLLPFGITNTEVLALLKKYIGNKNQKVTHDSFSRHIYNSPVTQ